MRERAGLLPRGTARADPRYPPAHAASRPATRDGGLRLNRLLLVPLIERAEVRIQQPIWAHDDSEPEPDVALVPLGDYSARHPDRAFLVIEVADSSLTFDRETKAPLYAASNVAEYWIVNLVGRAIEVCTEPKAGRFTTCGAWSPADDSVPARLRRWCSRSRTSCRPDDL